MDTPLDDITSKEETRSRWKTRRTMTWMILIFYFLTVIYGLLLIPAPLLKEYTTLFNIVSMVTMGILGSYFGFATWDDVNKNKSSFSSMNSITSFPTVNTNGTPSANSVTQQVTTTKSSTSSSPTANFFDVDDSSTKPVPAMKTPVHRPEVTPNG